MNKITLIARVVLGLIFLIFGLNGFVHFIPVPDGMQENFLTFMNGLTAGGYFMPLLKGCELICGALLIAGTLVPLALVALAPIVINIFLVHVFLAPEGLPFAIVIMLLEFYLAFISAPYSEPIRGLFRAAKQESRLGHRRAMMF